MTSRRKPVPREWREDNHDLSLHSHRRYAARGDGRLGDRAGGMCSCGKKFGLNVGRHNMNAADVRDAWLDHVAQAYHGGDEIPQRPWNVRDVEREARAAGPWTDSAALRADELRSQPALTDGERRELAIIRRREIAEAIRLRNREDAT